MPAYGSFRYGQPSQPMPPHQTQPPGSAPNIANLITSLDGPSLQKLLGAINPQSPQGAQNANFQPLQQAPQIPDLTALLGTNSQHQQPPPQHGYPQFHQGGAPQHQAATPYNPPPNSHLFANNPALASLLGNTANKPHGHGLPQQSHQGQPGPQQNVQNFVEQFAKWK